MTWAAQRVVGPCLRVPRHEAAQALEALAAGDLLDRRRSTRGQGGDVLIPVTRTPATMPCRGAHAVEAALAPNPRLAPAERVRWELEESLPGHLLDELPTGWAVLGEVCLVRMPEALADHEGEVAAALGRALGVASVLHHEACHGELREPVTRLLWGDPDTRTVHRENGLTFHLDPARVMFSPGNKHERHRLAGQVVGDETVVDLFAGIGYFTLPLARAGAHVIACEKNPVSAGFLRENVRANGLDHRVESLEGDCRDVAPTGVADRVLLGYFPGTQAFLACALDALGPRGGSLHYHTTASEPGAPGRARAVLVRAIKAHGHEATCLRARRVKSYAPGVSHVVLDVDVGGPGG